MNTGKIVQVIGPVVDLTFDAENMPGLNNAINIKNAEKNIDLVVEVAQHIGNDTVRAVALSSTDGLSRGMEGVDTGGPVKVPVGKETLGRIFNLLGKPIDT